MAFADSFASGFNSGLGMGLEQYNIAQRRKLAEEQAAREAEAHALRMEEARRAAAQARRIEDARSALETAATQGMPTGAVPQLGEATTADTYFGRTGYGQGLPAVQEMAGDYQREMGRFGLPQQAAQYDTTGIGAREATDRDINRLTQQYALAANDINAYRGLRGEAADMDWKDAFAARLKAARSMSPDEFAARMKQISDDQTLPGTFEWEQGKGDKEGKYFFLTPDRAMRVPLSKSEVVQLIALEELAQEDPVRAEEQIANLTGKAREVAFKVAQLINQQVATNNQAVNMTQDNARGERQLDLQEQALGIQRARLALDRRGGGADRSVWRDYVNDKGEVVPVDLSRLPVKDGVVQLPPGLRKAPEKQMTALDEARLFNEYYTAFGGGGLDANADAQARKLATVKLNIATGKITAEDDAAALARMPAAAQQQNLETLVQIDPVHASRVRQLLQQIQPQAPQAAPAPTGRQLPPPIARPQPAPTGIPMPTRGPVGQGAAILPWEQPSGRW